MNDGTSKTTASKFIPRAVLNAANTKHEHRSKAQILWLCLWSFYNSRHSRPKISRRTGRPMPHIRDRRGCSEARWMVRNYIRQIRQLA